VRDITTDPAASPILNAKTAYGYRNGSGGFTLIPYTGVTPNLWDDGSGTPAATTNGHFTIQRIYYFNESDSTIIYLGQTQYTTLALADASVGTEIRVIDDAIAAATLRCSLIIKRNTTDLTNTSNVAFFEASKFGASGAGSSSGTTTLQGAYNNSVTPEIITNATLGAVTVQRGSASDTDNVLEGKNGTGTNTFTVDGNGKTTTASLVIGSISGVLKGTSGTVSAATSGIDYENPLTFSSPLSRLVNAISIPNATTSVTGALTSTDWATFNGKQNALGFTPENVTNKDNGTLSSSTTTYPTSGAVKTVTDLKANIASPTFTGTVTAPILIVDSLTGVLKATSGTVSAATAGTDYENPLTFSAPLSRTGNAVSIPDATTSVRGALTSTDWNIFNNKIGNSFETVSKNLREFPYTLTYTLGVLTSITYTVPSGTIVKTLNYTLGILTSVVLSGTLPSGILTTKTLTYTLGVLTSVAYS
jgi:hypothetical protein